MKKSGMKAVFFMIVMCLLILSIYPFPAVSYSSDHPDYPSGYPKIHPDVEKKLGRSIDADVIIILDGDEKDIKGFENIKGFEKKKDLSIIHAYSGRLTRHGLKQLKEENAKVRVFENTMMHVTSDLSMSTAIVNANYSRNVLGITGRGVDVAIIDTGINYSLAEFGGCFGYGTNSSCRVFDGYDYLADIQDPMDDHIDSGTLAIAGHGTHVAAILAANGSIVGVAPEATLYALKACNYLGSCSSSDVIEAIGDAVDVYHVDIISMSLGYTGGPNAIGNTGKDPFSSAVDNAVASGVVVIVSAGNSGPAVSTINIPSTSESAISVAAIDDHNTIDISDDTVWPYSSRGPGAFGRLDPDISAPGVNIVSKFRDGSNGMLAGTSMAAAFVSGACALILEKDPGLSPAEVRSRLTQTTADVSGKVFERGSGLLDIRSALTANMTANLTYIDPYGRPVTNGRWEFVVTPHVTEFANLSIYNSNAYKVTLRPVSSNFTNMENSILLESSGLGIPDEINISPDSSISILINFTLVNFSGAYASTYGGIIILNGTMDDGSQNISKSLRIPVAITVPFENHARVTRTLITPYAYNGNGDNVDFDIYHYCYYNNNTKNASIRINWSSSGEDLDLYVYNRTADVIAESAVGGTDYESIVSADGNVFKWFKVDGYDFISPMTFNLDIADIGNHAPAFQNTTPIGGEKNASNILVFYRPNNITFNVSYMDIDNDPVTVAVNDSDYAIIAQYSNGTSGYAVLNRGYSADMQRDNVLTLSFSDDYEGSSSQAVTLLMYSSIIIDGYTPAANNVFVKSNGTVDFLIDVREGNNKALNYTWYINDTEVSNIQNYSFNSSGYSDASYDLRVFIQNNDTSNQTNETISWNVSVDGTSPSVNIDSPISGIYDRSGIDINYSVSDLSGVNSCWYVLNGTSQGSGISEINISMPGCADTRRYLADGNYTVSIYANDSVGNMGVSSVDFSVEDETAPVLSSLSPSGPLGYLTSVTLSLLTDENASCRYSLSNTTYDSMSYQFSDNVTSHTANYATSPGAYAVFIKCIDMSNNSASDTLSFVISSPPGGGGGGGSGGSGGNSGSGGSSGSGYDPNPSNLVKTFTTVPGVTNISVYKKDIPVTKVSMNSTGTGNATINISRIQDPQFNFTRNPVSAYLLFTGNDIDTESMEIYFNVGQGWLRDNNYTRDDIVLYEYYPITGEWLPLPTEYLNEDEDKVYYVSQSHGMGLYAISSSKQSPQEETLQPEENKTNITNVPSVHTMDELKSGSGSGSILSDAVSAMKSKQDELSWILWALFGTFSIVLVSLGLLKRNAVKHYENELIMATDNEFKQAQKVMVKKEPDVADIARKELSKMVGDRITQAKREDERAKQIKDMKNSAVRENTKR